MPIRKNPIAPNNVYHIFNKSIAGYKIFNTHDDFLRMIN